MKVTPIENDEKPIATAWGVNQETQKRYQRSEHGSRDDSIDIDKRY